MTELEELQRLAPSSSFEEADAAGGGSAVSIDSCLDAIGVGRLQWYIVLVAGLANASDSIEILMVSDVLTAFGPPGNCSICMNDAEKALLAAAMFVGMLFGGIICGSMGDRFGRRRLLMFTTLLNAVCGLIFSFASAPWALSLLRFGTGFGVGGGIPILFAIGSEAVPPLRRGLCLCVIASFFMVGQLVLTSFSLLIEHYGWRVFSVVCASFPLVTFIMAYFIPESPRFYSLHGDNNAAYDVLRKFAASKLGRDDQAIERLVAVCPNADSLGRILKHAPSIKEAASIFFSRQYALLNVTLVIVWISMNFGWYGLSIWMPSYFQAYGVKDFYEKGYYSALASLPGNLFSFWGMDRFGRKPLMFTSLLLSSVVAGCMYATSSGDALVFLFCLLNAVSVVAWNALDCVSTEAYPTSIRGFAFGLLAASGRLASASGQLVHIDGATSSVPLAISCVVLAVGALSSLKIPFNSGAHLTD